MCNGKNTIEMQQDSNLELPPGFRFHPTDDELVSFYLVRKISNPQVVVKTIPNVDLNKCEPWDLPDKAKVGEKEWYFFSLRDRKYPTGQRTNRATDKGYWKATGKDRDVMNSGTHCLVGMKKTLVFYMGRAPKGLKTNWIMHEYRLGSDSSNHFNGQQSHRYKNNEWVVCRVFQKTGGSKTLGLSFTDKASYQPAAHLHYALPGNHRDSSPNPTVTDSDDGDTCTAAESCHNSQDSYLDAGVYVAQMLTQGDVTSVGAPQWAAPGSVPMATPVMDIQPHNTMKESYYNHQNGANMSMLFSPPPQNMVSYPLIPHIGNRMRPKQEPFYPTTCAGEDEAESSQKLNKLDYAWTGDVLNPEYYPCDSPLTPLQSIVGESGQTSSCLTDGNALHNRAFRGSFSGFQEMAGPIELTTQEWAY